MYNRPLATGMLKEVAVEVETTFFLLKDALNLDLLVVDDLVPLEDLNRLLPYSSSKAGWIFEG